MKNSFTSTIPDEMKAQGIDPINDYLDTLSTNIMHYNEARIIILGEKGAGKTSLARKLIDINATMPESHESTEGVSIIHWKVYDKSSDDSINVHIWDFAGHAITHAAHRFFLSARCLYIYVFNGRVEYDNRADYWLEQIRIYGENSPILFLINQRDGHNSDIEKRTLKKKFSNIIDFFTVDIGNSDTSALNSFRNTVINLVSNNPSWNKLFISQEIYRVKDALQTQFINNETDFITTKEFHDIAHRNGIPDSDFTRVLDDYARYKINI